MNSSIRNLSISSLTHIFPNRPVTPETYSYRAAASFDHNFLSCWLSTFCNSGGFKSAPSVGEKTR